MYFISERPIGLINSLCTFHPPTQLLLQDSAKRRVAHPLVTNADEVVTELLDGVGGGTGLDVFRVVGDEDGLGGLDNDNTLLSL